MNVENRIQKEMQDFLFDKFESSNCLRRIYIAVRGINAPDERSGHNWEALITYIQNTKRICQCAL